MIMRPVTAEIERRIFTIRGRRVMLDADLAKVYGVTTARLNEQVKRNPDRFPPDLVFQITRREWAVLISQFATSKIRGGRRKLPYVFTKDGAVMIATVLKSPRAAMVTLQVVRAFNRMQAILDTHADIGIKIRELEKTISRKFRKHEKSIEIIFGALNQLMNPPQTPVVGFVVDGGDKDNSSLGRRDRRRKSK